MKNAAMILTVTDCLWLAMATTNHLQLRFIIDELAERYNIASDSFLKKPLLVPEYKSTLLCQHIRQSTCNARLFSVSGLTGGIIPGLPENIACFAQTMLTNCDTAKKYYQKAVASAGNDEQQAKATYMIAKCERDEYYNKHYTFDKCGEYTEYVYNPDGFNAKSFSYAWDGFKELKEKYAHTQYYKDVIEECEYFEVYVNSE